MSAITHYEVYRGDGGLWAMAARFAGTERDLAFAEARRMEDLSQPIAVIEENEEMSSGQFEVRLVHRSINAGSDIRAPAATSDLGSRLFMMALNAFTIGAVALILAVVGLSRVAMTPTMFNFALLGTFGGATLLSGLLLFRAYVPVGAILWRAKDADSRRRTILALAQGRIVGESNSPNEPPPVAMGVEASGPPDDGFQTTIGALPSAAPVPPPATLSEPVAVAPPAEISDPVPATPAPPPATVDGTAAADVAQEGRAALVETLKPVLAKFTDACLTTLAHARPNLPVTERVALYLYLIGAARSVVERNGLDEASVRLLFEAALQDPRVPPEDVTAFFQEFEVAGERPRYRRMMEDGKAAIDAAAFGETPATPLPTIIELLIRWSDPTMRGNEPQQVTVLLTDIVGSTAMTSELGNAGAQRVLRAHNAIVRAAAKAFRGREVKHTGDGMLMIFPDSTTGARAAMDIQQEVSAYSADNPTAPLGVRVGLHTGEAVFEDGEYYGSAIPIVGGLGGLVNAGEICCSAVIRQKSPSSLKFEDLGKATVKGAATPIETLKLLWEPKRPAAKGVLEYRQIGTTTGPALENPAAGAK